MLGGGSILYFRGSFRYVAAARRIHSIHIHTPALSESLSLSLKNHVNVMLWSRLQQQQRFLTSSSSAGIVRKTALQQQQKKNQDQQQQQQQQQLLPQRRRRLDVAIVGLPNAGKSQLLNVLTGSPVSAVSRKRHTTRKGILGARTIDQTQLMFLDTPGFMRHKAIQKEKGLPDPSSTHWAFSPQNYVPTIDHTLLVVDGAKKLTLDVKGTIVDLMLLALEATGRDEFALPENISDSGNVVDDDVIDDKEDSSSSSESERSDSDSEGIDEKLSARNSKRFSSKSSSSSTNSSPLKRKFSVVINKMDLVQPRSDLLVVAEELQELAEHCILRMMKYDNVDRKRRKDNGMDNIDVDTNHLGFKEIDDETFNRLMERMPLFFYTNALKQDGVEEVLRYLLAHATPCDVWEIDPHSSTDLTPEERVEEMIREKLYRCLHQEVPYNLTQKNTLFRVVDFPSDYSIGASEKVAGNQTNAQGSSSSSSSSGRKKRKGILVHQEVIVRTKSHATLVRGTSGRTLQVIQETAQRDLERMFKCPVKLHIHVKHNKSKSH